MFLQYCKDIIYHNYNKNPKLRQIISTFARICALVSVVGRSHHRRRDETLGEDNRDNLRSLRGRKVATEIAILTWTAWPATITVTASKQHR